MKKGHVCPFQTHFRKRDEDKGEGGENLFSFEVFSHIFFYLIE